MRPARPANSRLCAPPSSKARRENDRWRSLSSFFCSMVARALCLAVEQPLAAQEGPGEAGVEGGGDEVLEEQRRRIQVGHEGDAGQQPGDRPEEHTSELQSLMR